MPQSKNKKYVNVDKSTLDRFDYVYPRIKHVFAERAFKLALQDKKFFEEVFFNPLFIEVK